MIKYQISEDETEISERDIIPSALKYVRLHDPLSNTKNVMTFKRSLSHISNFRKYIFSSLLSTIYNSLKQILFVAKNGEFNYLIINARIRIYSTDMQLTQRKKCNESCFESMLFYFNLQILLMQIFQLSIKITEVNVQFNFHLVVFNSQQKEYFINRNEKVDCHFQCKSV